MAPILFIHGFPFDGSMWDYQSSSGLPMLAPDLPGFGEKPSPPPESASIEVYAQFVLEVILRQKVRPIVAGLSMGGYVLFSLLRTNPEAVAAAVFIDTRADADTAEARGNRLKSIEDIRRHGTANLIASMLPRLLAPSVAPDVLLKTRQIMERQSPAGVMAAQTAMAHRRDQSNLLAEIAVPTLIMVGEHDAITPPAVARSMQSRISGAKLVEIPGAGHMSPLENPRAVNAALREFAEAVPTRNH